MLLQELVSEHSIHILQLWADLVLCDFVLHDFTLMRLENLHHFSNLQDNFQFNVKWHRQSIAALIFCRRLPGCDVTDRPSVTCMGCYTGDIII
jgi:hypothetical protein